MLLDFPASQTVSQNKPFFKNKVSNIRHCITATEIEYGNLTALKQLWPAIEMEFRAYEPLRCYIKSYLNSSIQAAYPCESLE